MFLCFFLPSVISFFPPSFHFTFLSSFSSYLLTIIPSLQVVPFEQRVDVFQALLRADKAHFFQTDGAGGMMASIGEYRSCVLRVWVGALVDGSYGSVWVLVS